MTDSSNKSCEVQAADYAESERMATFNAAVESLEANRTDAVKSGNFYAGEVKYTPTVTPELEEAAKRYGFDHTQVSDATYPQPPSWDVNDYIPETTFGDLADKAATGAYAVAHDRCEHGLPVAVGINETVKKAQGR